MKVMQIKENRQF